MALNENIGLSFEFFPPKTRKKEGDLWTSVKKLEALNPNFVSVTYGAGGSTRERTLKAVKRISAETSLMAAAHLTCVGAPRAEIDEIARDYWDNGIRHIVALRGDPESGIGQAYCPYEGGYAYGSDLIAGLKAIADFDISVSAYPERHPESPTWDSEIDNLKRKIDAGANRAITQFFVTPKVFLDFRDRISAAGIDIPIIPGIMLQPNFVGFKNMAKMCGVHIPDAYGVLYNNLEEDFETRQLLTASLATELISVLRDEGVSDFHLYTLNRWELPYAIASVLRSDWHMA